MEELEQVIEGHVILPPLVKVPPILAVVMTSNDVLAYIFCAAKLK